jgi:hypothetical protein
MGHMGETSVLVKQREITFCLLRPDDQSHDAAELLRGVDGVHEVVRVSRQQLLVTYDVTLITLAAIDAALTELGFHLANNLLAKLKRALWYYTDETQRANLGLDQGGDTNVQVFIARYQRLKHGCRDSRPEHWRQYQ